MTPPTTPPATSSSAQTPAPPTSAASTARPTPHAPTTTPPPTSPTETHARRASHRRRGERRPHARDLQLDRRHPAGYVHHIGPSDPSDPTGDFVFSTDSGTSYECSVDGAYAPCPTTSPPPTSRRRSHARRAAIDEQGTSTPRPRPAERRHHPAGYVHHIGPPTRPTTPPAPSSSAPTPAPPTSAASTARPTPHAPTTSPPPTSPTETTRSTRAIDDAGNVDPTPATYSWTVDTTPPIRSSHRAQRPHDDSTGDFVFSTDPGTSYECSVDGAAYAPCPDNFTTADLPDGDHTLDVRPSTTQGTSTPRPRLQLTVDTTPPDTFITSGPSDPTNDPTGAFVFSTDSGTSYEQVDSAAFAPCRKTSPPPTSPMETTRSTYAPSTTQGTSTPRPRPTAGPSTPPSRTRSSHPGPATPRATPSRCSRSTPTPASPTSATSTARASSAARRTSPRRR